DRTTDRGLRSDVADAEAPRRPGEAAIGDQRHLAAHPLAIERGRGREHLAHAGAAARPLIADDQDLAFLVLALLHRLEAGLLAVEAARWTGEFEVLHAGDFDDRTVRREVAGKPDHAAGREQRPFGWPHHVLIGIPRHALHVLSHGPTGHGHAFSMQKTVIQ